MPALTSSAQTKQEPYYLRLIGLHDAYPAKNLEAFDASPNLQHWLAQIPPDTEEAWILLNNDFAGYAIATADRLRALLRLGPLSRPPAVEATLFG